MKVFIPFVTLLFILLVFPVYGQESSFVKLEDVQTQNKELPIGLDKKELEKLIFEVQPTVFIESGQLKHFESEPPLKAEVESSNLARLFEPDPLFNKVKLLKISFTGGEMAVDPLKEEQLQNFPELKYIYFECTANCTLNSIKKLIPTGTGIPIIYFFAESQ
ncbi:MAG: hypothetical protein WCE57_04370 [Salegentibacter sp.]